MVATGQQNGFHKAAAPALKKTPSSPPLLSGSSNLIVSMFVILAGKAIHVWLQKTECLIDSVHGEWTTSMPQWYPMKSRVKMKSSCF